MQLVRQELAKVAKDEAADTEGMLPVSLLHDAVEERKRKDEMKETLGGYLKYVSDTRRGNTGLELGIKGMS